MLTGAARDERGSLVLAMAVLMILTVLALAVLARSVGGLTDVRRSQTSTSALSAAEAGLADAVVRIAADSSGDRTGDGTLAASTFAWTASRVDGGQFTVTSTGRSGAARRTVTAEVRRASRFPYALFSDQDLVIDGTSVSVAGGAVGSNHGVIAAGSAGERQDWFTPSGSCSGCAAGRLSVGPHAVALPSPAPGALACPPDNTFAGVVDRGEYTCGGDVVFAGAVTLGAGDEPLVVHATGSVDVTGATVNVGGAAADVRLFAAGASVRMGGTTFVGAVDAPSARLMMDGTAVDVTGAVTVASVGAAPGAHVFRHDPSLDDVDDIGDGPWSVSAWRETAAG
jgi:Tfp pilus assembly protein PilX